MRKLQCFASKTLQTDPNESENRKIQVFKGVCENFKNFSKFFEGYNDRNFQQ